MAITDFAMSYQKSPIVFNGGIAADLPGGMLPVISVTQAGNYSKGVLSGSDGLDLSGFLFDFFPLPGGTLAENQIGSYPFANQSVAANSIITQPLRISLLMLAPVRGPGGYDQKLSVFQSLKSALDNHTALGGTYTVATPSYLYTDCILLGLKDVSNGDEKRPQSQWQWDFVQPLLTLDAARAAQNTLMTKISNGAPVTPNADGEVSYSGQQPAVGSPPSGVGPSTVSAARPLTGASVSGVGPTVSRSATTGNGVAGL